jgi:hypothetical protein
LRNQSVGPRRKNKTVDVVTLGGPLKNQASARGDRSPSRVGEAGLFFSLTAITRQIEIGGEPQRD